MRRLILCPMLILALLLSASCAAAPVKMPKVFRLADNQPEGYPTVIGDYAFADMVRSRTGGEIDIQVYADAALGDERAVLEQTQFGAVDFARVSSSLLSNLNTDFNILALPYLYRDAEHMFAVLDGPIGDVFVALLADSNLTGLCWFDSGARSFYTADTRIAAPEDMRGLRIRIQESFLMEYLVERLGGEAVQMTYGETYSAIRTGAVDGAENNFSSYMTARHYEVAKRLVLDEHTRVPELILANAIVMDGFTEEQRAIITEAAHEAALIEREEWARQEADYRKLAAEEGVIITRLSAEQRKAFEDAVSPIYEVYAKRFMDPSPISEAYADYAALINAIRETEP